MPGTSEAFRYPLLIGDVDPLDYRHRDGETIYDPGWWKGVGREIEPEPAGGFWDDILTEEG